MKQIMTEIDQPSPAGAASTGWERDGDHALRHPSGWTIARYRVDEMRAYLLWPPAGSVAKYGPFGSAEAAKHRHAELIGASRSDAEQVVAKQESSTPEGAGNA